MHFRFPTNSLAILGKIIGGDRVFEIQQTSLFNYEIFIANHLLPSETLYRHILHVRIYLEFILSILWHICELSILEGTSVIFV